MSDVCVWKVPPALTPHLSHGNDHDAFALAVGSGRPRSGSARPRSGSAFALKSHSNVLRNVGEYLSNSAGGLGLSLSLSPSLISVNLQQRFVGLSLFPPLSEAYLFPPPPPSLPATKKQLQTFVRAAGPKGTSFLSRSFAELFGLQTINFAQCSITGG